MKTLIFFRHGKSDWSSPSVIDRDRPLAPRGIRAARLMGKLLSRTGEAPDSVVTSAARRAVDTVKQAARAGDWRCSIRLTAQLYECSPSDILEQIRAEPNSTESLLVAGHEPSLSETLSLFAGRFRLRFPTGAMARLELPVTNWLEAEFGQAQLIWLLNPRLAKSLSQKV